jgi:translation initiation factor 5A
MSEDGSTKDDVKLPEGEVGDKITKLFRDEEKDTSE